ncbi:hypothetical protein O181_063425 [Austropuccinia psidii MF-1]|uniref:Uncharacterized protein n=1 Tax=Austropuccinia psidii MF-1 TaxID=1389203 RepID=A0A9Q3EIS7_9BASI|nr:hypothetical protein [Austropuccinia psidii MF-1]
MELIGTIVKEIILPHRKGNIRLKPEFLVLADSHIQGLSLETDDQRIYGIDVYSSKNQHITIVTYKEKKLSLDIYQLSGQDPLEEFLQEFIEGQFSAKLSLLKALWKIRPPFSIGEHSLANF